MANVLGLLLLIVAGGAEAFAASTTTPATTTPGTPPRDLAWQKLADDVEMGEMIVAGEAKPIAVAKVTFDAKGGTVRVLELDPANITQSSWEISGKVKYAGVTGNGYIEMWSHFPDGNAYFTRTLDTSGPMGVLHGKSEWREFRLPFFSQRGKAPSKLVVNVVLPEGGTVWLAPAKLKESIAPPPPPAATKAAGGAGTTLWWDNARGGRVGAVIGTTLGLYGAIIGIVASAARGRRLGVALLVPGLIVCGLLLIAGLVARGSGQPYAVWYPLTLSGAVGGTVMGVLVPVFKRRQEEDELRRMTALDA